MAEWYYAKDSQRLGPVPAERLKELAAAGQLQPMDLVWREGMPQWVEAQKVKGLFGNVVAAASSGPPPLPSTPGAAATPPGSPPAATSSPAALRQKIETTRQAIVQHALQHAAEILNGAAVARFLGSHAQYQQRLADLKNQIAALDKAKAESELLDKTGQQKAQDLAAAEAALRRCARPLGKSAFEAFTLGQVQDQPLFAERTALQKSIDGLHAEHDALAPAADAGILQKTKAKTQQLVVLGKIKLEETKIGKQEERLGLQLVTSNGEESVRAPCTTEALAEVARCRAAIAQCRAQCDETQRALDAHRRQVAQAFQIEAPQGSASLITARQARAAEMAAVEEEYRGLERQFVDQLLAAGPQPDERLQALLVELRDAQAQLELMGAKAETSDAGEKIATAGGAPIALEDSVPAALLWAAAPRQGPNAIRLAPPVSALLALILFCFPWITVSCSGKTVLSQSGLQSCYGGVSAAEEVEREIRSRQSTESKKTAGMAPFMIVYGLAVAACLAVSVMVYRGNTSLQETLVLCSIAAFTMLTLQLLLGFPLGNEISAELRREKGNPFISDIEVHYALWLWLSYVAAAIPAALHFAQQRNLLGLGDLAARKGAYGPWGTTD